jgi:hypothetical protein
MYKGDDEASFEKEAISSLCSREDILSQTSEGVK